MRACVRVLPSLYKMTKFMQESLFVTIDTRCFDRVTSLFNPRHATYERTLFSTLRLSVVALPAFIKVLTPYVRCLRLFMMPPHSLFIDPSIHFPAEYQYPMYLSVDTLHSTSTSHKLQ